MTTILTKEQVEALKGLLEVLIAQRGRQVSIALDLIATLEAAWALADKYQALWEASVGPLLTQEELDAEYEELLPSTKDMRGMSSDFTGDRPTEEHLRKLRQKDE